MTEGWEAIDDALIPGYVWCGHGDAKDTQVIVVTARRGKRLRLRRLTGPTAGRDIMVSRDQLCAAFRPLALQCGSMWTGTSDLWHGLTTARECFECCDRYGRPFPPLLASVSAASVAPGRGR